MVLEKDGGDDWTDYVKNEEVLRRVKKKMNILHTIKIMKANRIGLSCVGTIF